MYIYNIYIYYIYNIYIYYIYNIYNIYIYNIYIYNIQVYIYICIYNFILFQIQNNNGIGNEVVEPQLCPGQELTGDVLNRIFTQRTVWLLPVVKLECVVLDDTENNEVSQLDVMFYT